MLGGQGSLGTLGLTAELLQSAGVAGDILLVLLLDELDEVLHDVLVKVLSSQVGVTVGGDDLKDTVVNGQDGNIEGATAKVEDQDVLLSSLLVEAIGNGGGSWLVDDADNVEARDGSGILGGLPLSVIEVRYRGSTRQIS